MLHGVQSQPRCGNARSDTVTATLVVGLVAPRWAGEKVGWRRWSGLVLGLFGAAVVIITRSGIDPPPTGLSFLFGFLALVGITAGSLWEKHFGVSHHPVTSNLVGYTVGFAGVLPFMLLLESMHIDWTWEFTATLAYLVMGTSLVAVGLLLAMIRAGDVTRVSAMFFLVPPFAALVAWFVLDEIMPPMAWVGMGFAAAGVLIATHAPEKRVSEL